MLKMASIGRNVVLLMCGLLAILTVHSVFYPSPVTQHGQKIMDWARNTPPNGHNPISISDSDSNNNNNDNANSPPAPSAQSLHLGTAIRDCVVKHKSHLWHKFVPVIRGCIAENTANKGDNSTFLRLAMGRYNEIKYLLPLVDADNSQLQCKWLTIGIGGDSEVEKAFKAKYPGCSLYGIEPGEKKQYANFTQFGTVIPKGVGVEAGELTMRVRVGTTYEFKKVPIVPLPKLLDEYLHSRVVHFSTLDIEGFEYPLMKGLQKGHPFAKEKVVFCQLDVELHSPKMQVKFPGGVQTENEFDKWLREFIKDTDYVPLIAETFLSHRKVTFVNPTLEECRKAFDLDKYLK